VPDSVPLITVNRRGAARLRGGICGFTALTSCSPADALAGSLVHVRDERGRGLGSALYSSASQIVTRLPSGEDLTAEQLPSLLRKRVAAAVQFRRQIERKTDSYRVVLSEAELLPGLIVDTYNNVLSMQALTQAFDRQDLRQTIIEALAEHFPACNLGEQSCAHCTTNKKASSVVLPSCFVFRLEQMLLLSLAADLGVMNDLPISIPAFSL